MNTCRKEIVIVGGSGFIGQHLIKLLKENYSLTILTRSPEKFCISKNIKYQAWGVDITDLLDSKFAVINLLGENIGNKRWTRKQKERIKESRVDSANVIVQSIAKCKNPPLVVVQASAIGYYPAGSTADEYRVYQPSNFLSSVCQKTEEAISLAKPYTRIVIIRTGIVLARDSEFWKKIMLPLKYKIAPILSSGKQMLPWIHIEDEVRAIEFLLNNENCNGPFNLCAPDSNSYLQLIDKLQSYKKFTMKFFIPKLVLEMIFGFEKTREVLIKDQSAYPYKLLNEGFHFQYPRLNEAIKELLNPSK